ncbi:hypothetical protein [Acinetobacter sp. WZC-1]|uniref:hypothetical protein n=1 Tax=Acinetobacter sp. WZC-1 TaxID=3459034 RepID=UPI00403DC2EA
MGHYIKTELGIQTLKQRTLDLNARQRRLLVLIGTEDFQILNASIKQRLAPPELLQQLSDMGLITPENTRPETTPIQPETGVITSADLNVNHTHPTETITPAELQHFHPPQAEAPLPPLPRLGFDEIRQLMISMLQQYCGLMAKQLIIQIQGAQNLRSLKLCQMQWLTAMQETRISPVELNRNMQQINSSLHQLQPS